MQPRCVDSGARFSTTASGTVHTRQPREPTGEERARRRAWLWRFVRQRGCSSVVTDPVHPVVFVSFRPVWN
jgi:hypothetical protein